jgi:hypothetical protein
MDFFISIFAIKTLFPFRALNCLFGVDHFFGSRVKLLCTHNWRRRRRRRRRRRTRIAN